MLAVSRPLSRKENLMMARLFHRRLLLIILSISATIAVVTAGLAPRNRSGVTECNWAEMIRRGKTVKEVESVFGMQGMEFPWGGARTLAWRGDDGALLAVAFDEKGKVEKVFGYSPEETILQRIIRHLHGETLPTVTGPVQYPTQEMWPN
jgi:hypothetical protein